MISLRCEFQFEAAHRNLTAPPDSPCARLHGHSYVVTVAVAGPIDPQLGWVMDFADIRSACVPVIHELDHRCLNDIPGMRDTSRDDVDRYLSECLAHAVPGFAGCSVGIIGDTSFDPLIVRPGADGEPRQHLHFGFAAAHFLPRLPIDHKCRRLHGHSYRCIIDTPNAQSLLGALADLYAQLHHRLLNDIPGLENPTSENLAHWIWQRLASRRSVCEQLMIRETCTSACTYTGEAKDISTG